MGLFFEEIEVPPLLGLFPLLGTSGLTAYTSDLEAAKRLSERKLGADQFTLFQLLGNEEGPVLADLHNVRPTQTGSRELPDIRLGIDLVAFNISTRVPIETNTRATMRIDIGEDSTANTLSDSLFWAIAAGIDLYKAQGLRRSKPADEFITKLSHNFRRQPIDLAGSVGILRVAIVAHEEPSWWRRVFNFAADQRLSGVLSTVGFPAITGGALKLIDSFFDLLNAADPRILIHSRPITMAFSQRARDDFDMGSTCVKLAVLNPGWFLMLRYADVAEVAAYDPIYLGGYGVLIPRSLALQKGDLSANPLNEFTYAVLRVKSKCICLNHAL